MLDVYCIYTDSFKSILHMYRKLFSGKVQFESAGDYSEYTNGMSNNSSKVAVMGLPTLVVIISLCFVKSL